MPMMNRFAQRSFLPPQAAAAMGAPMVWASPPPPNPPAYVMTECEKKTLNAPLALLPTPAWSSNLFTKKTDPSTGQVVTGDTWTTLATTLALAGTGLGAYHGYRRTDSVGWAIVWGLLGGLFPIITIPVAFAQGFGQRK